MGLYEKAKKICDTLSKKGFIAYFAGGFVRDMLLGIQSQDIDIATSATPEQIASLFPDHVLVGAQFGVVIVKIEGHQFEVASFRLDASYTDGRHPSKISLTSSPEEDASRRDFTINGMFFDPETGAIYDYVGGKSDLENRVLRTIGNPISRFEEDKLRMVRAARFSVRFNLHIEEETHKAIEKLAPSLFPAVSMERIFLEFTKMHAHCLAKSLLLLFELGLLQVIFPPLSHVSEEGLTERLAPCLYFDSSFPVLLILATMFSLKDKEYVQNLPLYLKTSKAENHWIEMWLRLQTIHIEQCSDHELAHLFANPHFFPTFTLTISYLEDKERLHKWYKAKFHELLHFIERIKNKLPLVKASDLMALGVPPGPKMGELLRLAEEIEINNHLKEKENVLHYLREKY